MFHQCAIGEAKSLHTAVLIDDIDDSTGVQRIEPEVTHQNRDIGSDLDRGAWPVESHPRHAKHLPGTNRLDCPLPTSAPLPIWIRLWSALYPAGMADADLPTSGTRGLSPPAPKMKCRTSSSEGAVKRNKKGYSPHLLTGPEQAREPKSWQFRNPMLGHFAPR